MRATSSLFPTRPVPWWFALSLLGVGYYLANLQLVVPPTVREAVPARTHEARGTPLLALTRQLATERRRLHELEERLDVERTERKALMRQAIDIAPGEGGWPCGLRSLRTEATRLRKVWCANAEPAEAAAQCSPPIPLPEYFVLTFSPTIDSSSSKIIDHGGFSAPHHLPWLDAALAFMARAGARAASSSARSTPLVVDVGGHFGTTLTLYALARGARVVAVEMQPAVARALRLSAQLNGWHARLQLIEAAVGPRAAAVARTPLRFNSSCENSAAATVRPREPVAAGGQSASPVVLDAELATEGAPL